MRPSPIKSTIDLDADGKAHGFLTWSRKFLNGAGILEMIKDFVEGVQTDDVVAHVHDAAKTGADPATYRARRSGMLIGRHHPGLIRPGDCLSVIADVVNS